MKLFFRRMTMITSTVAVVAMTAATPVLAQVTPGAPTVGPAGGVASTTAPSNSAGTPAGGTGVISTTRVGPSGVTPAPAQSTAPTPGARAQTPRRRTVRHTRAPRTTRPVTEVGTQSQSGLNGSAAPSR